MINLQNWSMWSWNYAVGPPPAPPVAGFRFLRLALFFFTASVVWVGCVGPIFFFFKQLSGLGFPDLRLRLRLSRSSAPTPCSSFSLLRFCCWDEVTISPARTAWTRFRVHSEGLSNTMVFCIIYITGTPGISLRPFVSSLSCVREEDQSQKQHHHQDNYIHKWSGKVLRDSPQH